jgi:phosphatidylserine/phosphatidylglycerophosphate/cardiolipin synthase-like enzyme
MVDNLYEEVRGARVPGLDDIHQKYLAKFKEEEVIKQLFERTLPNVSWNHAKILAVNGQTLLTGGANFWNEYADNEDGISDIHVKVKGDAAISAHTYCDYFWR